MTYSNRSRVSQRVRNAVASLALGAVLVAVPDTALAKGTINAVTASPTNPLVGQVVTITVKGSGTCGLLQIAYGDGTKILYNNVEFQGGKVAATKKYMTAGAKSVQVKGKAACSGSASTQVQVQPKPNNGGDLEVRRHDPSRGIKLNDAAVAATPDNGGDFEVRRRDPSRGMKPNDAKENKFSIQHQGNDVMKFLRPKIQGISSIPGPRARPGADLHITGIAFGDQEGSVYIHGTFNNSPRKVSTIKSWSDTKVIAQVPVNWGGAIGGVCGWTIQVEVRSAKNVASYKAGITWAEQHRELSWKDSAVSVTKCGYDGNIDMCNGIRQLQGCFITTFSHDGKANPKLTIDGLHFNCAGPHEDDAGTDKYAIALPPGWVFETLLVKNKKTSDKSDKDNKITGPSPAFPVGKTNWNPSFGWNVTQDDWIRYEYLVKAKAPETCPWPN